MSTYARVFRLTRSAYASPITLSIAVCRKPGKSLHDGVPRPLCLPALRDRRVRPVLSRKLNESIVINHDIVVTVLAVQGGRVRLGIEAPLEIPVHRQEVYEKMQNEELLLSVG